MAIIIVGKNSLIGKSLAEVKTDTPYLFLSHQEALSRDDWLSSCDTLINLAFSSALKTQTYAPEEDIDQKLAHKIKARGSHYIMMSSRTVYGPALAADHRIDETQPPSPQTLYGQNKWRIERQLIDILGPERLTILRGANIFGHEYGRTSFFGMALKSLKEKNKIVFDMNAQTKRDFIATWHIASALAKIGLNPQSGIYNLGSGYPLTCHQIAEWLIEGYGSGSIHQTSDDIRDDFYLDMNKTQKAFNLQDITPSLIRQDCVSCGQAIR